MKNTKTDLKKYYAQVYKCKRCNQWYGCDYKLERKAPKLCPDCSGPRKTNRKKRKEIIDRWKNKK